MGELSSLSGEIKPISGVLPVALIFFLSRTMIISYFCPERKNTKERALVGKVEVYGFHHLNRSL